MKKILPGILLSLFVATVAVAFDGSNAKGFYVGVGAGSTGYDDGGLSNVVGGSDVKTDGDGVKVYLGYQFNNVIAIELGYADYGKFAANTASNNYSFSAQSYSVAANVGYSFMNSQLRLFANLGLAYLTLKHENIRPFYTDLTNDNNVGFHYGIGLQYEPNILQGFGVRVAYEADMHFTAVTGTSTADDTYTQVNSILYAAIQYKF